MGGLNIINPAESAPIEYQCSSMITNELKKLIIQQDRELHHLEDNGAEIENAIKHKNEWLQKKSVQESMNTVMTTWNEV